MTPPNTVTASLERFTIKLPFTVLQERLARVRSALAEQGLDAVVAFGSPRLLGSRTKTSGYIQYLAGFAAKHTPSTVVLTASDAAVLTFGPHETRECTERSGWLGDVIQSGEQRLHPAAAVRFLSDAGLGAGSRIGVIGVEELSHATHVALEQEFAAYATVTADSILDRLRLTRAPEEVEMIRISAKISDAMVAAAFAESTRPGASGPSIMAEIEHTGRLLGADLANCWLSVGEEPPTTYFEFMELPPEVTSRDRVQMGTTTAYEGYFGQCLRMGVRGTPSRELAEYSEILLKIQDAALAVMRPGEPLHRVIDVIEDLYAKHAPFSRETDPFRFQSCHGLGLTYVEPGMARDLNPLRDKSLDPSGVLIEPGMVIEVHPNFTVPGLGCVVAGDMALVNDDGAEWITESPRGVWEL
ncbi:MULTISPECIES: Xaa-Pro peptidase family protein [Arthrobacter]|uniref:Aminopeptidase P family protein n=1 Tax=Arthrobacter terricola TaxID=2547396 RepID=A0A4R5KES4_9MICC|nr:MULTISPECIES: M24 family metallopeptidase [Arthrobacter]MBT8161804.1 M24 family metallopeptidase [Arthrobacter sp. GN70]TDF92640.1 aminopeptidase P family protein [Arthrobacter terricola]